MTVSVSVQVKGSVSVQVKGSGSVQVKGRSTHVISACILLANKKADLLAAVAMKVDIVDILTQYIVQAAPISIHHDSALLVPIDTFLITTTSTLL
jgi:hypothetical protein